MNQRRQERGDGQVAVSRRCSPNLAAAERTFMSDASLGLTLGTRDAAAYVGMTYDAFKHHYQRGHVPSTHIGRSLRFRVEDLQRLCAPGLPPGRSVPMARDQQLGEIIFRPRKTRGRR